MDRRTALMLLVIISLTILSACSSTKYITKTSPFRNICSGSCKKAEILAVVNKSDEWIEFSRSRPGRVFATKIAGEVIDKSGKNKTVSIPLSEIKFVWMKTKSFTEGVLNGIEVIGKIHVFSYLLVFI